MTVNPGYAAPPMPGTAPVPGRRYPNSTITSFHQAPPRKKTRNGPDLQWIVVVRTGSLADHHRFDDEVDAINFALTIDPDFAPPGAPAGGAA